MAQGRGIVPDRGQYSYRGGCLCKCTLKVISFRPEQSECASVCGRCSSRFIPALVREARSEQVVGTQVLVVLSAFEFRYEKVRYHLGSTGFRRWGRGDCKSEWCLGHRRRCIRYCRSGGRRTRLFCWRTTQPTITTLRLP